MQLMIDEQRNVAFSAFNDANATNSEWDIAVAQARCTFSVSEYDLALYKDGNFTRWARVSSETSHLFNVLRETMADENGAWFSATVSVRRSGSFDFSFNYDEEPQWDSRPFAETLEEDLQRFPRPADLIPSWHPSFQGRMPADAEFSHFEALAAIAVYDAALPTPGWDKATLRAENFLTDTPTASIDCNRGLSVIDTIHLTNSAMTPIFDLHREMEAMGRSWNSMTLWLEASDGSFTTSYE